MGFPACPICTSKKWRKAPGTGELICSEGHVLQGYRNETIEITEMGAHTVHRRQLRTGRRRKAGEQENLDVYYGPRARYLYYQCRQLVLRHQIDKLISEWGLPAEAKNICRTIWLLSLDVLPNKPPPQPWVHAQTEPEADESSKQKEEQANGKRKVEKDEGDQSSGSESSNDDQGDIEAQMDQDIENLLHEASETDSDPGVKGTDTSKARKAYNRDTRHTLYDSAAMNISVLVLTCWWLRVPATYFDLVNLINSYRVPYLEVVSLLPDNMRKHLSVSLRQELTPPHAPTVTALHIITRRVARRLHMVHGVDIPEFNAAPVLWRAVRAFQGPPTLYTMAKQLMERLEVPLTIHPSLAPKPSSGIHGHPGDWAPVEVTLACVLVVVLKFVYGFQDNASVTPEADDPASCFPSFSYYLAALRRGKEGTSMSFSRLLSRNNKRTAETLCDVELDEYLDVAERALGRWSVGNSKSMPFKQLVSIYGEVQGRYPQPSIRVNTHSGAVPPEALDRPSRTGDEEEPTVKLPGERILTWSPNDPLGALPPDYALLVDTASTWTGVEHSTINRLVAIFEHRLQRTSPKGRQIEIDDSEQDAEFIDIDRASLAGSEEEKSKQTIKYEDEDEEADEKTRGRAYTFGSQVWRERVHTKLSKDGYPRGAYKQSPSSPELDGTELDEGHSKDATHRIE